MPRAKQAKAAEPKKRLASTKWISEEEVSPKKAKVLKDSDKDKDLVTKLKTKPGVLDKCVFCNKSGVRTMLEGAGSATNMRFHLAAEHYFPEGKFKDLAPPSKEDLEPGKLLPNDLNGKQFKYTCTLQPCTKRKQGYKEMVLHLATQHELLKEVMQKDKRPGVAAVFKALYPEEGEQNMVQDMAKAVGAVGSVKQEKKTGGIGNKENIEEEVVDDPSPAPAAKPAKVKRGAQSQFYQRQGVQPPVQVQSRIEVAAPAEKPYTGPRIDKVHNCLLCEAKEGRNLSFGSGLMELRNHYSVCLYNQGKFKSVADPREGNRDFEGKAVDEYGRRYKYKCQVPECPKSTPKAKPVGFKEWAIHAGVAHHLVEKVMQEEVKKTPALKEVLEEVTKVRVAAGIDLDDLPEPFREEIHNCLLCAGKDKDGLNLSLDPGKLWAVRYHYASCYFDTGVYQSLGGSYLPGDQNSNEDGSARDVLGREVKYRCMEAGCTMKRQVGYKELCIHMASDHGGLERVMTEDEREEVRDLVQKIRRM